MNPDKVTQCYCIMNALRVILVGAYLGQKISKLRVFFLLSLFDQIYHKSSEFGEAKKKVIVKMTELKPSKKIPMPLMSMPVINLYILGQ